MTRFLIKLGMVLLLPAALVFMRPVQADQRQPPKPRPYLGARLSGDVPDLLRTHLDLGPEQGLLVQNIYRDGPADKAGLAKDDILLSVNDKPLTSVRDLYRTIHDVGIDESIIIERIHRGQLTTATVTLEQLQWSYLRDRSGWKYPIEPEESMVIRPGRMFRMPPGEREWIEIPLDQLEREEDMRVPDLDVQYHFLHDDGQEEFTIIIEGNPHAPDASVTIKTPDKEYFATARQVDKLPSAYRQTVLSDIKKAKETYEQGRNLRIPAHIDFSRWQQRLAEGRRSETRRGDASDPDETLTTEQRLERQLQALTRQIEHLQRRQQQLEADLKDRQEP